MLESRAYRSKIGRLPAAVRHELNERLRDGATAKAVIDWVSALPEWRRVAEQHGFPPLTEVNVCDWRATGYADWLRDQDRTAQIPALASLAESIVIRSGGDPAGIGSRILAGRLLEALENVEGEDRDELVKQFSLLRAGELDARKVDLAKEKNDLQRQALDLETAKFQRQTCSLFLKWYEDEKAREIVEDGSSDNDAKTEALGQLMFGRLWGGSK